MGTLFCGHVPAASLPVKGARRGCAPDSLLSSRGYNACQVPHGDCISKSLHPHDDECRSGWHPDYTAQTLVGGMAPLICRLHFLGSFVAVSMFSNVIAIVACFFSFSIRKSCALVCWPHTQSVRDVRTGSPLAAAARAAADPISEAMCTALSARPLQI